MLTNIRYILLTALRDWLFAGLVLGVIAAVTISSLLGSTALIEPEAMTISFSAASARLILMTGLIVFVCFHIRHAFDSREIDVILSRPISRSNLVFSYWLGFATVSLLLVVPTVAIVGLLGVLDGKGFAVWAASLLLETWFVVALALFASLTLRSAVSAVLACFGFYVLSRMMGFFILTSQSGLLFQSSIVNTMLRGAVDLVSVFLPRLDFYGKTEWLIYGLQNSNDLMMFLKQSAIFIPLLVLAAVLDFRRKQF
jgi:ABC-type transport system involved in multi-copper enzyme maturation permease subunit